MFESTNIRGDHNVVIQDVTDSHITVKIDGQSKQILKQLGELKKLLESLKRSSFFTGEGEFNVNHLDHSNFDYVLSQSVVGNNLPSSLKENLVPSGDLWVNNLKRELVRKHKVAVGNHPAEIFQHYGFLIEKFVQKVRYGLKQEPSLYQLSLLAQAWQNSLRYLSFIQLAQILQSGDPCHHPLIRDFLLEDRSGTVAPDLLELLLACTDALKGKSPFVPELMEFVNHLRNPGNELYVTTLFLKRIRNRLLQNSILEDEHLRVLIKEYLTAFVFWLRKISFLAGYRMVSIKDISLSYRLGTSKDFIHIYGELHGIFERDMGPKGANYITKALEDTFTYNKSILLLKGKNSDTGLEQIYDPNSYLSLSPLLIDESVLCGRFTQTPEVFYFSGRHSGEIQYEKIKNDMVFGGKTRIETNDILSFRSHNHGLDWMDDFYDHLETVLEEFKMRNP